MLVVTVIQVACSVVAVYYGARTAMALGRDLRTSVFDKVETFAAREVAEFGAPTLITRSTNDVQQIQLLAFMTFGGIAFVGAGHLVMATYWAGLLLITRSAEK